MSKTSKLSAKKSPKSTKGKGQKTATVSRSAPPRARGETREDLVVFAFRLTAPERELIHQAAGPARASRFVRSLAVAASQGDEKAIRSLVEGRAVAN